MKKNKVLKAIRFLNYICGIVGVYLVIGGVGDLETCRVGFSTFFITELTAFALLFITVVLYNFRKNLKD